MLSALYFQRLNSKYKSGAEPAGDIITNSYIEIDFFQNCNTKPEYDLKTKPKYEPLHNYVRTFRILIKD